MNERFGWRKSDQKCGGRPHRFVEKSEGRSLLSKEERNVLRPPLTRIASSLKWMSDLTSVRLFRLFGTVPGRSPHRLDIFSYLDKRRSLGLCHFFDTLARP